VPLEYQNEKNAILVVEHGFMDKLLYTARTRSLDEINSLFNRIVLGNRNAKPFLSRGEYLWLVAGNFVELIKSFAELRDKGKPFPSYEETMKIRDQIGVYEKENYLFAHMGASVYAYEMNAKPIIEIFGDRKSNVEYVQIADASKIQIVRNFPAKDGFYLPDGKFGIPAGREVPKNSHGARKLIRADGSFSGFIRRGHEADDCMPDIGGTYSISEDVMAGENQSSKAGALVSKV
jgi:hypothetical protein